MTKGEFRKEMLERNIECRYSGSEKTMYIDSNKVGEVYRDFKDEVSFDISSSREEE